MATEKAARRGKGKATTNDNGGDVALRVKPAEKGKRRGSWEHLKKYQYPKGVTGNPGGVPKDGKSTKISAAYSALLGDKLPDDLCEVLGLEIGKTWADAIALQVARKAVDSRIANPSFTAVTELRETTEGKTPDKAEIAGAGGAPLSTPTFQVNFVKAEGDEDNADRNDASAS